jgi:hypothetical protein
MPANYLPEPHSYRDFEHAGWERAASSYQESFGTVTRLSIPALLDVVQAAPAMIILDVAQNRASFCNTTRSGALFFLNLNTILDNLVPPMCGDWLVHYESY